MRTIDIHTERMISYKLYQLTYNMNPFKKQLINQRVNQLTTEELLYYASKYRINLSLNQANKIIMILKNERFNIADHALVMRQIKRIDKEISSDARNKILFLIEQLL